MDRLNTINSHIKEHQEAIAKMSAFSISSIATHFVSALNLGGTIYSCGNGGSSSDAAHLIAELVGRFEKERKPLKGVCLNSNIPMLTAIANDYGYDKIFSKQIEALATKNDLVVGITTSGNSKNVTEALLAAKKKGATTVAFVGNHHDMLAETLAFATLRVPSLRSAIIQECHIMAIHAICSIIETECTL